MMKCMYFQTFLLHLLSRCSRIPTWTAWSWWKKTTWGPLRSLPSPLASTDFLMWVALLIQQMTDSRFIRSLSYIGCFWCLPEYFWSGVCVQRGSSNGQILLGEEQRFSGQGLEKEEDFFSSIVFRLSSVFTLGRPKPSTRRGCISCSQLKPKTTLNWCGANIRENITH